MYTESAELVAETKKVLHLHLCDNTKSQNAPIGRVLCCLRKELFMILYKYLSLWKVLANIAQLVEHSHGKTIFAHISSDTGVNPE